MTAQVLILSEDAVFSRMLALEFRFLGLRALVAPKWEEGLSGDVILLDLDSALPPSETAGGTLIGFTRAEVLSTLDLHRRCSVILRRPFDIQVLAREVLASLPSEGGNGAKRAAMPAAAFRFDPSTGVMSNGHEQVLLGPQEARLLSLLLSMRGQAVSRAAIADVLGAGDGNKTEVYICYLRRKLAELPGAPGIRTVRGVGYRVEMD